jgi:6-pyruvoyltetrahydropterin/6-carboxytetrahydropterin synthase
VKYQISKKFCFEAAHRMVKNYNGKCNNNHGHSWTVTLFIEGNKLDDKDMLIDFNETKKLGKWIDDNFDHASILWEKDPFVKYLQKEGHRVFVTKKSPTSEHIAEIILQKAREMFENKSIKVSGIEVSETCTAAARIFV